MNLEPGEIPDEDIRKEAELWMISRVCEEFSCLPEEAREAINNDYNASISRIIDMRGFASAKARIDSADSKNIPTDTQALRYLKIQMNEVGKDLGIKTSLD